MLLLLVHAKVDNDSDGDLLSVDMCTYNSIDGWLGENVLGNLADISNKDTRNNMQYFCDNISRFVVSIKEQKLISRQDMKMQDKDGNNYRTELNQINNDYLNKDYCFIYGATYHALGSARYEDMGVIKMDICKAEKNEMPSVVSVYHQEGIYVGEPIFVPDPNGSAEDDGALLVVSREKEVSRLLIFDAKNMEKVAQIQAPFPLLFEFHGAFFSK